MTASRLDVVPLDPHAYALLAEEGFGAELFNPSQHVACELVERYATALACDLCRQFEIDVLLATPRTAEEVRQARGWDPQIASALEWVLARLAAAGHLVRSVRTYRLDHPLPPSAGAMIRERGLATDPSYAPAYDLLDAAAAAFPAVARRETTGEQALFGKPALWLRYFDNRHAYYALNNRVTARAAAARLPPAASVLEVGAGLGSATEALLDELGTPSGQDRLAAYRFTEPVAFFRRRAERVLTGRQSTVPFVFNTLNVNDSWTAQGIAPGTQQLVWGVNVFHLARDLDAVLREAHAALAPRGWLVVGEGMRPAADAVVAAEFPFRLLESFTNVALDPVVRPTPGFLTAEHWQAALARTGFADVTIVPDAIRLHAYHPGMLAAAVCGRRA
jgi:SAM-dependent methyltransferase